MICVFLAVLIVGNSLAITYSALISTFLGQETTRRVEADRAETMDTSYFSSQFKKQSDLYKAQIEYAETVQAEGSVLLQNAGLPMAASGSITLLGSGCAKDAFLVCGGGSGSIDTSKTPSLKEVFEAEGYSVNGVMWDFYTSGAGKSTRGNDTVGEAPLSSYTDTELASFDAYHDAAVVVIGRLGAEDRDVAVSTADDPEKSMLELSQNELDLIDLALQRFDNVVVLLNTLNPIELGPLVGGDVSILWICAGGQQGLQAIPGILNGTYNPSGRLVDTYACDNFSAPAMVNFGDFNYGNYTESFGSEKYLLYQEGIYVGYKYYETRYEDAVLGAGNAGSYDYAASVAYPFGVGLSYTQFAHSGLSVTDAGDHYDVKITVQNTGEAAGKDVVEVFLQKPYTDYDRANRLEKASVELAGFGKTSELAPGASEEVTVSVPKEYLRAYDAYGSGG